MRRAGVFRMHHTAGRRRVAFVAPGKRNDVPPLAEPPPHPTPHPPPSVDTDCSCWANYLLEQYFPAQYALLPNDTSVKPAVPRAAQYYDFMDSPTAPWEAVPDIRTVRHGDVLAYKLPPGSTDTGHVSG